MEHNGSMQVTEDHRTRVAAVRREKMRARLLEAALQIIADEGTAALSIDRLILQAGVSRGTFYKYYDAPQALVRELALGISNELISNAEPLVQLVDDPAVRIAVGLRALMHTCRTHPVLGHFLVHLGWQDLNQQHLMFDYVKRDLDQAQQLGRFGVIESDLALSLVGASALVGIQVMMKSPGQVPNAPEETTAAVLRALGMKDPEAQAIAHLPLPPIPLPEAGLISRVTKMVKTERSVPG